MAEDIEDIRFVTPWGHNAYAKIWETGVSGEDSDDRAK
jgi:hypothetical protein